MADFASFTHKWRAAPNDHSHSNIDKISKRNRQPVSCQPCRLRKLKCSKGHPCEGCLKRNEGDGCTYGRPPVSHSPTSPLRRDETRSSTAKAQDRLKHLEDLVRSVVDSSRAKGPDQGTGPEHYTAVNFSPLGSDIARAPTQGGSYVGSTHWSAILQHIHELKNDMNSHTATIDENTTDHSKPDALFGDHRPPSLEYVLNLYLPPRVQVDRRISQYFNAKYFVIPFLHSKQFQRQYELFWADPINSNPLWVSIMFSICYLASCLSLWSARSPGGNGNSPSPADSFEAAAGQCLVLGNYSKPQPFVVDALSLFLQCKMFSSLDPQKEVALIFSVQVRMAYLMGYHRDGSHFPDRFTVFETEIRRRSWAMIKQFDVMASFQLGLPSNVRPETWDTRLPSNLIDADFDVDSTELPPSRPASEVTQMLYFVVKARVVDVYSKVCHHAISFPPKPPTLSEIMVLDAEVREYANTIPDVLKPRPVSQSITDHASDVMVRINLSFLWRKSLCVLHRKYMTVSGMEYSYNTCVEAASAMCDSIIDLFPEFQPGGTFENEGWMIHSFTIQDFLLAVVILCLAMSVDRKRHMDLGGNPGQWPASTTSKHVLDILDKSQAICLNFNHRSKEARRVSIVVSAVLERLRGSATKVAAGNESANYFLNMSNGTLRDDRFSPDQNVRSARNGFGIDGLSLSPGSAPVPIDANISRSDWHTASNDPVASLSASAPTYAHLESTAPPRTPFPLPHSPAMDVDVNATLSPFTNILSGFELESMNGIDWTSFDRLNSIYGEAVLKSPSMGTAPVSESSKAAMRDSGQQSIASNYDDWNSLPHAFLGGRARHPVTGESSKP